MRALVTGGAGLIGSHLADLLLRNGWQVRILDNLNPVTHPQGREPVWLREQRLAGAEFWQTNVEDAHDVARACVGVDVVFHQAALGGFTPDVAAAMTLSNACGTVNVMDGARAAGVKKVVVASSQAVYGHGYVQCPGCEEQRHLLRGEAQLAAGHWDALCDCDEEAPYTLQAGRHVEDETVDLPTVYALSKFYAERVALKLGADWRIPVVALRYALTFGPRQSLSNPYTGIASMFATRLAAGRQPDVYEDGMQMRDFTYVGDVAAANLHVALNEAANGQVFNVGTGFGTSVLDFAYMLAGAIGGYTGPIVPTGKYRPQDARHVVTDPSALMRLGWQPKVFLPDSADRYAEWFLETGGGPVVDADDELAAAGILRSRS